MTDKTYLKIRSYVSLIARKDNQILLMKRENTGYMDGYWAFPGGTLEELETLEQGIVREIKEEINLDIQLQYLNLVHVLLHYDSPMQLNRIGYYFSISQWSGSLNNNEPDKHSALEWFNIDDLPENMTPWTLQAFNGYKNKFRYSQYIMNK